jgi:hypothetical protein
MKDEKSKRCELCAFFLVGCAIEHDGECYRDPPTWEDYGPDDNGEYASGYLRPEVDRDDFCSHWTPQSWHNEVPE